MINKKFGFTLIELMIVIAIMGVLSSVVMTSLNKGRDKAKMAKALATMQRINNLAYACVDGGGSIVAPADSGTGGTQICSNDATIVLPNITDTGFTYCGGACGGWFSLGNNIYALGIRASFNGATQAIVCAMNYDASTWFGVNSQNFNFTNKLGCVKSGF